MRNLKLSTKLYLGFGLVMLILALVGANAFFSLTNVVDGGNQAITSGDQSKFMVEKEGDHLRWINKVQDLFMQNRAKLKVQMNPHKCGLGKFLYGEKARELAMQNPALAKLLEDIKEPHSRLHESAALIDKTWKQNNPGLALTLAARMDDHHKWAGSLAGSLLANKDITVQTDPTKCAFGKWLAGPQAKEIRSKWPEFDAVMAKVSEHHIKLHESAKAIKEAQLPEERIQIYDSKTMPELAAVGTLFGKAQAMENALDNAQHHALEIFDNKTLPALADTQANLKAIIGAITQEQAAAKESMEDVASYSKTASLAAAGLGVLVGLLLAFFITRAITKPIDRVVDGLTAGAGQVAAASSQVSDSSQSLAEGSSQQAAALEETSSSLEEMSSMSRQNSDNAQQADTLMKEAVSVVGMANKSMLDLKDAMARIDQASGETAKIIKTIDEIAFQTNLLALNAAVEAARAGEAGAGFAVVADEVRSLAMRAAEAAKNTQDLIEGNLQNIEQGSKIVTSTDEAFNMVEESAKKVAELVAEIAAASEEQTMGISQINDATVEMDKVTQQVASNAEESAAASEELSAQAMSMQDLVGDLLKLVEGNKSANGNGASRKAIEHPDDKNNRYLPEPDWEDDFDPKGA
jgi:methyl-accepting chemotaxis protein